MKNPVLPTTRERSLLMRRIRGKDTAPEKIVRSTLHRMGFRYRLHVRELPGKPDIVLPRYKTVIFVHGCFWHHHYGCKNARLPKQNAKYWVPKLEANVTRFALQAAKLRKQGWRVCVIWECETPDPDQLRYSLLRAFDR